MSQLSHRQDSARSGRRAFLRQSGWTAGFLGLGSYLRASETSTSSDRVIQPYGPLVRDKAGLLDLPKNFSYEVISRSGTLMADGMKVPGKFDDMAAFPGDEGKIILIRNHEVALDQSNFGPFPKKEVPSHLNSDLLYDAGGNNETPHLGGTTTIIYNPASGKTEKEFLSLAGTDRNCSGGTMPWGSWITCEEPADLDKGDRTRQHGYCFEVRADPGLGLQKAVALKAMGRFRHEAVAYDPGDGSVYLTEDRDDGLLYRFVPDRKNDLSSGNLQAMCLKDHAAADLRNYQPKPKRVITEGQDKLISWVDLEDPTSPKDDLRIQGFKKGAAKFARGEGIFYDKGAIYLCCTNGGPTKRGQIFRILPSSPQHPAASVELFLEPGKSDLLTSGDNLCVAPNGDLIICEDLVSPFSKEQLPHLRGVTPEGQIFTFGRNPDAKNKNEFCGSIFSPDGDILFVNIQNLDHTFAIRGPWRT